MAVILLAGELILVGAAGGRTVLAYGGTGSLAEGVVVPFPDGIFAFFGQHPRRAQHVVMEPPIVPIIGRLACDPSAVGIYVIELPITATVVLGHHLPLANNIAFGAALGDLLNALPVRIVAHRRQGQAVGAMAVEVVLEIDAHATNTQGGLKESNFMF